MKRTDKRSPDYPSFFLGGEAICFSSRGFSPTGELKLWYAFDRLSTITRNAKAQKDKVH